VRVGTARRDQGDGRRRVLAFFAVGRRLVDPCDLLAVAVDLNRLECQLGRILGHEADGDLDSSNSPGLISPVHEISET
jgi:hypothetical protein